MQRQDYYRLNHKHLKNLPPYINSYYIKKINAEMSQVTLNSYLMAFDRFFNWLRDTGISSATDNTKISLTTLQDLELSDAELFKGTLLERPKMIYKKDGEASTEPLKKTSVNPNLAALKSLFKYLAVESESGPEHSPLINRNVMAKIDLTKNHMTLKKRSEELAGKLLVNGDDIKFVEFIDNEFATKGNPQQLFAFEKNKIRDIAIISLFLATGVRLSELCNLDIGDIHLEGSAPTINVIRKGDVADTVSLRRKFVPYIQLYLDERKTLYPAAKNPDLKAVFVATSAGKTKRIGVRTVENLVRKYSSAFGTPLHPHLLRHSVASGLYEYSGHDSQLVQQQLGQSSPNATQMYEHVSKQHQNSVLGDF